MDDVFEAAERETIARLLARHFALDPAAVTQLIATAEERSERSTQLYPFIRTLLERLDGAGRIAVIEMLWDVAYADGVLHPDEDALIRRIGGLLFVSDHDRGEARRRVLRRLQPPGRNAPAAPAGDSKDP